MEFREFLYMLSRRGQGRASGFAAFLAVVSLAAGCAGSHQPVVVEPVSVPAQPADLERAPDSGESGQALEHGVYHVVQPGQTLWRIAVTYGLTPEKLARANAIEDPTQISTGRTLLIPGATSLMEVPPYPAPLHSGTGPAPEKADRQIDAAADWIWPVPRGEIRSYFGAPRRDHRHAGVDIGASHGAKIVATRGGVVEYSGSGMRGYGKTVIVDHGDGYSSLYAHNSKLIVQKGQRVRRGETIALVGRSGNASGEHCHFEIRRNDRPLDPLLYLIPPLEAKR